MRTSARWALLAAVAAGALFSVKLALADRLVLWRIVHEQCAPAAANGEALPPPCLAVHASDTIIKDRNGVAQLLDIPNAKVTGIEDSQALALDAPNYFAAAWRSRGLMDRYLKQPLPREAVAVAVNSEATRSQDQLHLHIDCLRPDVAKTLAAYAPHIDATWRPMTEELAGRKFWVRRIDDLDAVSPFHLIADDPPAPVKMGESSLALVALVYDGKPGFALLADPTELTDGGHAEDIQDHGCAIAQ